MIRVVRSCDAASFRKYMDQMHQIRARVFKDRLNWDVDVVDGKEIDVFDDCDPVYLLSINPETDQVEGSLRLLQTTGPNMLRDVFPQVVADGLIVESPTVWESSRFSIDPDLPQTSDARRVHRITSELLYAIVEVGLLAGLTDVVSVYDARMARIFRAAGCPAVVIGGPVVIGTTRTYAGLFEMSYRMLLSIGRASNLSASVIHADPTIVKPPGTTEPVWHGAPHFGSTIHSDRP